MCAQPATHLCRRCATAAVTRRPLEKQPLAAHQTAALPPILPTPLPRPWHVRSLTFSFPLDAIYVCFHFSRRIKIYIG